MTGINEYSTFYEILITYKIIRNVLCFYEFCQDSVLKDSKCIILWLGMYFNWYMNNL